MILKLKFGGFEMYKKIGKKIKILAMVLAIILAVFYVLAGMTVILFTIQQPADVEIAGIAVGGGIAGGVLLIILGPVVAWLVSWFLYGYGELIDNTSKTTECIKHLERLIETHIQNEAADNSENN